MNRGLNLRFYVMIKIGRFFLIPPMEFTRISNLEIILGLGAVVSYFYLGLAVYLKDPKSWTSRLFAFFVSILIAYTIVNPISLHPTPPTSEDQLFWIRMVILVASFIGPTLFLLIHTFPHREITLRRKYIIAIFIIALANAVASLTPLVFESISYPEGQPVPVPGKGIILFVLSFPVMVFSAFGLLIKKYLRAIGEEKVKLFYFLIGIVTTFSLMVLLTITLVVVFKTPAGIFLGPISPLILTGFIAYSIIKHRFLDIHPIIARTISFIVFVIIFALIYALVLLLGVQRLLGINIQQSFFLILLGLTVAAMLTFQTLERFVRSITDRLFFQGQYDTNLLLVKLTKLMAETIDLDHMAKGILNKIIDEIKISKAAFLIVDDHKITDIKEIGGVSHSDIVSELEDLFHQKILIVNCCTFEELDEGKLKDAFRKLDISAAIPIRVEGKEVAILVLGIKRSGEVYYARDMDFLNTFSSEAGIAIQNAKSYQRIKNFSKELEQRVMERTKELKESQENELAKAQEVAKLKDEFVFIAAHELRTPVTAIRGFLELTSDAQAKFPKDIRHNLEAMSQASSHLNQLINDLLEIARSNAGIMSITSQPREFEPILAVILKEIEPLAGEKELTINTSVKKTGPVLCDPAKLKEVLMNLLSNAIKYNRDKGAININAYGSPEGGYMIVEIEDTGYGIPKDQQEKIFQKFFRASIKETQEVLGTGLGLFLTRMLVEKMGGKIFFSSTDQKGTTFTFTLPLA